MEKINVLIVDDHSVVRQGLRTLLELHDQIEISGEASHGLEALEEVGRCLPDVVLMDLVMPEMDGIEATRRIRALSPTTQVIVLTSFGEEEKVFAAIKAGALSYLLKNVPPGDLVKAVESAYRGETQLAPEIAKRLIDEISFGHRKPVNDQLTDRELQVLRLISQGRSNREIAAELVVSEKTVKTHVSNILGKLHLADRTQAAIYAIREGFAVEN